MDALLTLAPRGPAAWLLLAAAGGLLLLYGPQLAQRLRPWLESLPRPTLTPPPVAIATPPAISPPPPPVQTQAAACLRAYAALLDLQTAMPATGASPDTIRRHLAPLTAYLLPGAVPDAQP